MSIGSLHIGGIKFAIWEKKECKKLKKKLKKRPGDYLRKGRHNYMLLRAKYLKPTWVEYQNQNIEDTEKKWLLTASSNM